MDAKARRTKQKIRERSTTASPGAADYENFGTRISRGDSIKPQRSVIEPHRPWPAIVFEIEMNCLEIEQFLAWIVASIDYVRDS
jgi:hypothetical protein